MLEDPDVVETRSEEFARKVAEAEARRVMSDAFSRAGYNVNSDSDMQRWSDDQRYLSEWRKRRQYHDEHRFRATMIFLGAILTTSLGAIGTIVVSVVSAWLSHKG